MFTLTFCDSMALANVQLKNFPARIRQYDAFGHVQRRVKVSIQQRLSVAIALLFVDRLIGPAGSVEAQRHRHRSAQVCDSPFLLLLFCDTQTVRNSSTQHDSTRVCAQRCVARATLEAAAQSAQRAVGALRAHARRLVEGRSRAFVDCVLFRSNSFSMKTNV
jgi:hypothetical protein